MSNQKTSYEPVLRIWVGCLASYNAGILHGEWVDCLLGEEHMWEEINKILKSSSKEGAEEWEVLDVDSAVTYDVGRWPDLAKLATLGKLLVEHGRPFEAWLELGVQCDLDVAEAEFQDCYQGCYNSKMDFAEEYIEDCCGFESWPELARRYFDCDQFLRDLEFEISFIRRDGEVYVFRD